MPALKVSSIQISILKEEQNIIAQQYKSNPKKFWKYVNSKTKRTERIGDLKVNKNSSGDEIANVNFLRRYGTYVSSRDRPVSGHLIKIPVIDPK